MFIQVEQTPNPDTLKFIPGKPVMPDGTAEFKSDEDAERSPLAKALFDIPDVVSVFYGSDFVSVTKTGEKEWLLIKPKVLGRIMEHYTSGASLFNDEPQVNNSGSDADDLDDDITKQIKELLDTRVRPAVAMDGGDITFERFENGILYLKMQGACSGCPSSTATLKVGIENMMRHFVPEVMEVRPVEG